MGALLLIIDTASAGESGSFRHDAHGKRRERDLSNSRNYSNADADTAHSDSAMEMGKFFN